MPRKRRGERARRAARGGVGTWEQRRAWARTAEMARQRDVTIQAAGRGRPRAPWACVGGSRAGRWRRVVRALSLAGCCARDALVLVLSAPASRMMLSFRPPAAATGVGAPKACEIGAHIIVYHHRHGQKATTGFARPGRVAFTCLFSLRRSCRFALVVMLARIVVDDRARLV